MTFVPLRLHSEYSVNDGVARLAGGDGVVARAAELGLPAAAITDIGNMFGALKFYESCRRFGVKPIIGCEAVIAGDDGDGDHHAIFLCASEDGYRRLSKLLSRAYEHGGKMAMEWLNPESAAGIIALSGARRGEVGRLLLRRRKERAQQAAEQWRQCFPGRFYLEVWRTGSAEDDQLCADSAALGREMRLPLVAAHPVQCARAEDMEILEVRRCIANNWLLSAPNRERPFSEAPHLPAAAEMQERFSDLPGAIENTVEIAKRCNFSYSLGETHLPRLPAEVSCDEMLRQLSEDGLQKYLRERQNGDGRPDDDEYSRRLAFELNVIKKTGFGDYFIIVADFVGWAKRQNIPVGPGRGSGAGSLTAFVLGITAIDPIKHGLLFERFLNPERVSLPDFDIDFCVHGRDKVIEYVGRKYGEDKVSQIVTFGTIGARSSVRDVGRVLGFAYGHTDRIAKMIPPRPDITLAQAEEESAELRAEVEKSDETARLMELARKLEGLPRNIGTHAGGVLIAPHPISDFCPLFTAADTQSTVSQMDMGDIAKMGLVKFDFLGLKTLTILQDAVSRLRETGAAAADFSLDNLPLDDSKVFALYSAADTIGVFQCESSGMRDLMRRLRPDRFEDIVALMALYRPGPLKSGMVDSYIRRKHGEEEIRYPHESLHLALGDTYGVCVYQEQVMEIARRVAGYSLGEADLLRRAMGKKNAEEMAQQRNRFVRAAKEKMTAPGAEKLFDTIDTFAGYGFNKSHAAAYALLSYFTAYLKTYHPAALFAAVMTADSSDTDRLSMLCRQARARGLAILPPDINIGRAAFCAVDDRSVRYGLAAIKGLGGGAIEEMVRARGDSPFADLFDVCRRLSGGRMTQAAFESLIGAGALDSLHDNRAAMTAVLPAAMGGAATQSGDLFGGLSRRLPETPPWEKWTQLTLERRALGFCLSGSFYELHRDFLRDVPLSPRNLNNIGSTGDEVRIAGVLARKITSNKMRALGFERLILEDGDGEAEVKADKEKLAPLGSLDEGRELLIVEGRMRHNQQGVPVVTARRLYTRGDFLGEKCSRVQLQCDRRTDTAALRRILTMTKRDDGGGEITLNYRDADLACALSLGNGWRIDDAFYTGVSEAKCGVDAKFEYYSAPR